MKFQTVLPVLFAGCCLFAVVSMSATLESGVQGSPDDVIDVDADTIPLPSDEAEQLKDSLQPGNGGVEQSSTTDGASDTGTSGAESSTAESASSSDAQSRDPVDDGQSGGDSGVSSEDTTGGESTEGGTGPAAGVEGLFALLRQLLRQLLGMLGPVLLIGAVGLLVHRRGMLWDRFSAVLGRDEEPATARADAASRVSRSPENEVERLWLRMLSAAGVAEQPAATPRERAETAVEAGLDGEAVRELTDLFEDVRYGEKAVTAAHVRQATESLRDSLSEDDD